MFKLISILIIALSTLLGVSVGQIVQVGQCNPSIDLVTNFDMQRFVGTWYEVQRSESEDQVTECAAFGFTSSANVINVQHNGVNDNFKESSTGTATLVTGTAQLNLNIPLFSGARDFWVLLTDYDNFAVTYACENISATQRRIYLWVLSRQRAYASQIIQNNIAESLNTLLGVQLNGLKTIDHTDIACYELPIISAGQAIVLPGQCDSNIPVQQNFNFANFLGTWHQIANYYSERTTGNCVRAQYTSSNNFVNVVNSQVVNQALSTISGTATISSIDNSARIRVVLNSSSGQLQQDFWVIATDYINYAISYSCVNVSTDTKRIYSWILSRDRQLSANVQTEVNRVIGSVLELNNRYFTYTDQSEAACFNLPAPTSQPVQFPGQCDATISAMANFDLARFSGLWHDIESYPASAQSGTCNKAQYTLNADGSLRVEHSQVINQGLQNRIGSAVLTSADGSAKLQVVLDVNEVPVDYWVLSTDYTTYALMYSCRNVDAETRQVHSWKLSRTSSLTATANTAINAIISTIDVLNQQYFVTRDHSDAACFTYPDNYGGDVVLPGQCVADSEVPAVTNFDPARYAGTWYEIFRFQSSVQTGECFSLQYSVSATNTFSIGHTFVNDERQTISTMQGTIATNGRGVISTTSSAVPWSNIYILATDYTDYSLVYSCRNIDTQTKQIYSWKLSRTRSGLSTAANNVIDQIVSDNADLWEGYYKTTGHDQAACFYLPEPTSQPVQFPGQCDTTIPAMANFDLARFSGLWHDIESYPASAQSGTCNKAQYTLNVDGSLRVEHSQVVNQGLQNRIGSAVLTSTDGSAKLQVVLEVNEVPVDYWVLSTDYTTYAFMYACRNVDAETRQVHSWKLSRTSSLTATANTAINAIISNIDVLNQQYFVTRDHSDVACFAYPDNYGGDVVLPGQCVTDSAVPAVTNFDPTLYSGTWYEISRFPSSVQTGECFALQYTISATNTFSIGHTFVSDERQTVSTMQGTIATNGRGVISTTSTAVPWSNIYILATDYTNYSLVYSCRNIDTQTKQIYSWKLSRTSSDLSAANDVIDQIVSTNDDLWEGYYSTTSHDEDACFYYPVFGDNVNTIELPGSCPTNITGVPNFNLTAYLGRWYEVARYPNRRQSGKCNRAEYGPGESMTITNAEVANQSLRSISGYADVGSTDGSGVLNVVLGGNRRASYYVLATDYISYALLYNCGNRNNGYSTVNSWQFSRTPILSAQSAAAMVPAIVETRGILEEYYQATSQTDEDCFYIPAVNNNEAPVFRGQCETISGLQGFDVQRYLGWWHEIERYPVDGSAGECRSSQYTLDGTTYRVVNTQVQNNTGTVLTGTVTVNNNGMIRRSMADGTVQDIWVLATDYDTYALLYSCENIDSEHRRVWSAKHSKSRSLTTASQTAMASVIANKQVLYDQFYLQVDQTDGTCFHYPAITQGDIIIPGQCDLDIPVVQDFNTAEFAATWYHVERYDDVGQSSCIGSSYTISKSSRSAETIDILNYEVRNGELLTVEGSARLVSTDGSARLQVTLPTASSEATTTTTVSILETDYTGYALCYSCTNVNSFQRQVRAWKLSRTRALPSAATTAINNLISERQELHQPYFKQISQSDDCAEPSSAFITKSSIIILVVCALLQSLL